MSYADQPRTQGRRDADSAAYRAVCKQVKDRAQAGGELCWFYRRPGHEACPGGFDFGLHWQDKDAITVHHLHRRMDGGDLVPDVADLVPAHRGCNARDGLRAQNERRAGGAAPVAVVLLDRNSRQW
jgi:hypothetical protein